MKLRASLAVAIVLAACGGPSYVYQPETANAVAGSGLPAARVEIPQERPQGSIQITSYGVTEVSQGDGRVRALHVREIVANDGDEAPWVVDSTHQLVAIAGEGQSRALYANSDVHTLPVVTLARHDRHVIDLYFPLPHNVRGDRDLPRFDVMWQVETGSRPVASRTTFDRVEVQERVAQAYVAGPYLDYYAGYGPYWWYDPFYPGIAFVHVRPIIIRDHRAPVVVGGFRGRFHTSGGHVVAGGTARRR
jgi:hypothetical protein